MNDSIYMDNHATTPIAPEVFEAMVPYLTTHFGNAASSHRFGTAANAGVETARLQVAALLCCSPEEIVFTSGATESDNLAITGTAYAARERGNHIITCATEHHAVLDTCHALEAAGFETTYLPVDRYGLVDPDDIAAAITPKTVLMSFMYANNEIGTIQPLADIAALAAKRGVIFHSDAVQGIGRLPSDMQALGVDLASLTAHKIYGPKGVGALYVRRDRLKPNPIFHGGGQEAGVRPGTLNVAGIVGLGAACELAQKFLTHRKNDVQALRDSLHQKLAARLPDLSLNGHPEHRLPGNLNLCFPGAQSHALLAGLKDIALSAGSACDSESVTASHVLLALGVPTEKALTAVRFGLGRYNTAGEVDYVADAVIKGVTRLRDLSGYF